MKSSELLRLSLLTLLQAILGGRERLSHLDGKKVTGDDSIRVEEALRRSRKGR